MKKIVYSIYILLSLTHFNLKAQSFWKEDFGFGCTQGFTAFNAIATPSNGAWTTTSFLLPYMNGPDANQWFVSAEEQGQNIGVCGGITCGGLNDRTLHMGANVMIPPLVDIGADYESGPGSNTNKRADSPLINCTGHSNLQLSFKYMAEGIPGNDYCEIEYSDDGGTTWYALMIIPPSSSTMCPTNGFWKFFAVGLPSSLSNNPNVKIGFHWYNNDPVGAHPSIAIDDIELSELTANSASTINCVLATSTASIVNNAIGNTSYTWSAIPNTVTFTPVNSNTPSIQFSGIGTYTIMANGSYSPNGVATSTAVNIVSVIFGTTTPVSAVSNKTMVCAGSSATLTATNAITYAWSSGPSTPNYVVSPSISTTYTVTGVNGHCSSTYTIQQIVNPCAGLSASIFENTLLKFFPNPFSSEINFVSDEEVEITVFNMFGEVVKQCKFTDQIVIPTSNLASGIYILVASGESGVRKSNIIKH